jgi:hypothetical protein
MTANYQERTSSVDRVGRARGQYPRITGQLDDFSLTEKIEWGVKPDKNADDTGFEKSEWRLRPPVELENANKSYAVFDSMDREGLMTQTRRSLRLLTENPISYAVYTKTPVYTRKITLSASQLIHTLASTAIRMRHARKRKAR